MTKTIALIDDSSVMRAILRKAIRTANLGEAQFLEATNGNEGYELLKSNSGSVDLAFVDLHMPERGGLEMLQTLHNEGLTGFPIVVVSAEGDAEMHRACTENGACDFIKKPFRPQEIVDLVGRMWAS